VDTHNDFGTVLDYSKETGTVWAQIKGRQIAVKPATWSNFDYFYDEETHELKTVKIGVYYPFPTAPAYAVTIHKAQGQTLERAHVVLGRGCFASGQLYTALSRVRSLEALTLDRPVKISDILVNARIEASEEMNEKNTPDLFPCEGTGLMVLMGNGLKCFGKYAILERI